MEARGVVACPFMGDLDIDCDFNLFLFTLLEYLAELIFLLYGDFLSKIGESIPLPSLTFIGLT